VVFRVYQQLALASLLSLLSLAGRAEKGYNIGESHFCLLEICRTFTKDVAH